MLELPRGLKHGDEVVVEIKDVTERGLGRASLEALVGPDRLPKTYDVFVRKAVPGDTVRVRIERARRGRCTGGWVEMIKPSVLRVEPRCPHFGRREEEDKGCGGCTFQSVSYRHQLAIKERLVKDRMKEAGVDPGLVLPVKGMDDPYYYRNKMEFTFGDTLERDFALGLYPTGYRYEILNLQECFLQSPFVSDFLPLVRQWAKDRGLKAVLHKEDEGFLRSLIIREGKRTGERLVELMTTAADVVEMDGEMVPAEQVAEEFAVFVEEAAKSLDGAVTSIYWTRNRIQRGSPTTWTEIHLAGQQLLSEELRLPGDRTLRFEIHPRAFFQPNTLGAELLYSEVIEKAGLSAEISTKNVLDLYCGTGTIGLCLAPFARRVFGIEMQKDAVENARKNAATNEIENIEFFAGDVGKVLGDEEFKNATGDEIDLVVVDPPRKGLFPEAMQHVMRIAAPTLVYVSCNPTTLAMNLKEFINAGYRLEVVQPVDMFPQTFHVENVALLRSN